MPRSVRRMLAGALILAVLLVLLVIQRHTVMFYALSLAVGESPPLLDDTEELPSARWFDDYYTVEEIAPNTFAIGEPRYYQLNFNYLIIGEDRALLFDAGPGVRDIRPVVESLTDLPLVFLPSHFHYDHVGNGVNFEQRAVVDLPYLRQRAEGNNLTFDDMEHLGPAEGFEVPTWNIDHWWAAGDEINLGDRSVTILHTPGHSPESISLYDAKNNYVLSGDYLYPGMLFAFTPGSSMQDYLQTAEALSNQLSVPTIFYGAHRFESDGLPTLQQSDLTDLRKKLIEMRDGIASGEGVWPMAYPVNDKITILADPRFLQDWD